MRVSVNEVPIYDLLNIRMRKPDRVQFLNDLCLYLLVLSFPRISGNGNLCYLQGLPQIGIQVHMLVKLFGVER